MKHEGAPKDSPNFSPRLPADSYKKTVAATWPRLAGAVAGPFWRQDRKILSPHGPRPYNTLTLQSLFFFSDFLVFFFFLIFPICLVFFVRFSFFSKDFKVSAKRETLVLFGGFSLPFSKKKTRVGGSG